MGVGAGLYMYDVVVKKFTLAISSPDEFLLPLESTQTHSPGLYSPHKKTHSKNLRRRRTAYNAVTKRKQLNTALSTTAPNQ